CQPGGTAGAVLLRAGEVIRGEAETRERRGPTAKRNQLARGPGNLAACLGVTGEVSGSSLSDGPVTWSPAVAPAEHEVGPRVGVSAAADTPWRMWVPGEPTVSAYRAHKPRRRRS
ncbi:MAG: DNA-3-methyladenine glycosylase, partial [Nocardioidaceae bacterium]